MLWVVVFFGVCGVGVCGVGNVVVFVFFGLFGFGLGVRAVGFVVISRVILAGLAPLQD